MVQMRSYLCMVSPAAPPHLRVRVQPQSEDWSEWIRASAIGDQDALARLYDSTNRILYGLTLRILRDKVAAEDVLLEVYVQVWRRGEIYKPSKGTPLGWLLTIARSRAIDALRSRAFRECGQQDPLETVGAVADPAPSPEENTSISQRRACVQRCLAELPKDQREAIELAFFSGLSHTEVAETLGQPLGTVKTRVRLGMFHLRESLRRYEREL